MTNQPEPVERYVLVDGEWVEQYWLCKHCGGWGSVHVTNPSAGTEIVECNDCAGYGWDSAVNP